MAPAALVFLMFLVLPLPLLSTTSTPLGYDPGRRPFDIRPTQGEIVIDGVVDEPAWDDALALRLSYEQSPGENTEPSAETTVLLTHDQSAVYAAFLCQDPNPEEIRARYTDRDRIWEDDWVLLVLDTFNSEREAYNFAANPLGIQGDTYESPNGESDSWDAIWDSAGRITSGGYEVEMAIPLSSLRFQGADGEQVWGFDVARHYPRNVDRRLGFFPVDRDNECYACQYSKIVGFRGATPGRNIEFDPTLTGLATQERVGGIEGDFEDPKTEYELGATGRWSIAPNLVLAGAANPDFSQVEADARQLDVNTQFALFYEEKRPFFLEGADIFADRLGAIHTRTIADPTWGAKLTGHQGDHTVGAFVARDAITNLTIPGAEGSTQTTLDEESTAAALRYHFNLGRSSGLGMLATHREGDSYRNSAVGIDAYLRFLKSERLDVEVLGTWTEYPAGIARDFGQPDEEFLGAGYDVAYNHRSENVHGFVHERGVDDDFRSDLGYRPRVGERHTCAGVARNWRREAGSWFTIFEIGTTGSYNTFTDGDLQSRAGGIFVDYSGPLQSYVHLEPGLSTEVYEGREYDLAGAYFLGQASPTGAISVAIEGVAGDAVDYDNNREGQLFQAEPSVVLKLGRHLALSASHSYARMDVAGGRLYTTNISFARAVYQLNARTFVRGILQYVDYALTPELYADPMDPEYRSLSSQLLFSYKINPQTVFYLGYSDEYYGDQRVDVTQTGRTFFAKLGYAWVL